MLLLKFCNPWSWRRRQLCSLPFGLAPSSLAGALSRRRGLIKNNPSCSKGLLLSGKYVIACSSYIHPPEDHKQNNNMTKTEELQRREDGSTQHFNSKPELNQLQQLIHSDPSGGWEKCWVQEVTPWDLGQPTPVILHLSQMGVLPKGRVLVPGCGSGRDVTAIASPDHYVVGLDISDKAIKKAVELSTSSPNADYVTFLKEDFFSWQPDELFDLIFDYTFFCAIEPNMRLAWGSRMKDLLKPDGELITLMFPIGDHLGGPPYKVSVASYEEVLLPMGFKATCIMENKLAIGARKGREKIGWWKKSVGHSFL